MAEVYTPGLSIRERTTVVKKRLLPIDGEVLVGKGDNVNFDTVVAVAKLPGPVHLVNVVNALGITPAEIHKYMVKRVGETVGRGECIAESKPLFGIKMFQTFIRSPVSGSIENISSVTGQVQIREPPIEVKLSAYVKGRIREVYEKQGVLVESDASYIQGIFGIGGENFGELYCAVNSPDEALDPKKIDSSLGGKVVVAGKVVLKEHIDNAIRYGVRGMIAGGVYDHDIREILGYEIGVAITGNENISLTLVITEGFGELAIASKTFSLLQKSSGSLCAINGTTQIRAGVQRPEIIIPVEGAPAQADAASQAGRLEVGSAVRIIRDPHFGVVAKVTKIIDEPQEIETGSKVRIVEVELPTGSKATVPRCNIELL